MAPLTSAELRAARERMVRDQLRGRGIVDGRVLDAMARLPREEFLDAGLRDRAYDDGPLPIGAQQTISQPWMVARMLELLELSGDERSLEIGAGSGYQTALLSQLCAEVYAVERVEALAGLTRERMRRGGRTNVTMGCFDGSSGWPEHAPYDAIVVAAGAPSIPVLLVDQLADEGRLVVPVGERDRQQLAVVTRRGDRFETLWETPCVFVPLLGRYGWNGPGPAQA